ncbi:recombinase family protein [Methylobacterium sp. BTF04]|uniref:recombinase family protein n=1 Tax=Methylobacterium sp. BTF04 TaxID=2708300 RepID=UPI0013D5C534|nr:recombinase family protein [Methylobacterium sp. BTF04]NEU14438.1 recombinase family protein [Methylobacterium sp. BTF04]
MKQTLRPAIAYTRVSTQKQEEAGNGHDLQMTRIREFARHAGYRIVQTFRDAETGMGEDSIRGRKGVMDAISFSREKKLTILVDGLDRFARNVEAIEEAIMGGRLKVLSCKSGEGASHAVLMAEAARAQHEGELISINTKRALKKLKEEGVQLGNPTNLEEAQVKGAAVNRDGALERARELAPVISKLREEGRTTAKEIADGLNLRGLRTARGEDWNEGNVRRLLQRVAEIHRAQEEAKDQENPNWGMW